MTEPDPGHPALDLLLNPSRSRVTIHTFAEGMLARLAHDLELIAGGLSGVVSPSASRTPGELRAGTASVEAPLRSLMVAGVLTKNGQVDERTLSPTARRDCTAKMLDEVFHARPGSVVRIDARLDDNGAAHVVLTPPNGKAFETVVRPELHVESGRVRAVGTFDVSLQAIGLKVIKGPMGAFRVKDRVVVSFDVVFAERVNDSP